MRDIGTGTGKGQPGSGRRENTQVAKTRVASKTRGGGSAAAGPSDTRIAGERALAAAIEHETKMKKLIADEKKRAAERERRLKEQAAKAAERRKEALADAKKRQAQARKGK